MTATPRYSIRWLSFKLGVSVAKLKVMSADADSHYRLWVRRCAGKCREIHVPSDALKFLQRRIRQRLLVTLPLPEFVNGCVKGRSALSNALAHVEQGVVASIDVKDCYPSITHHMVYSFWRRLSFGSSLASTLTKLTTHAGHLPQGTPTSDVLANLILAPTDDAIDAVAKDLDLTPTRYLDNIDLSGPRAHEAIPQVVSALRQQGLAVRHRKTYCAGSQNAHLVTGYNVNGSYPSVPKRHRAKVRAAVHRLIVARQSGESTAHRKEAVKGHLEYLRKTNPGTVVRLERELAEAGIVFGRRTSSRSTSRLRRVARARVPHLVAPRAKLARRLHTLQEVRVAEAPPIKQHCLIDDVGAIAHRLEGGLATPRNLGRPRQRLLARNLDDGQAVSAQLCEKALLVLDPALRDPVENGVRTHWSLEMAVDCSSFEMHEVSALQCRDNVGCGVDQPAIDVLHLFDLKTSRRPRTGFRSLSPENVWQQVEGGQTPPGAARHLIWARTRRRDSAQPVSRRPAGSTLWKSAAFTFVNRGRLEDMPVRCLTPSTQQRVRPGGRAFRPLAGAPGPRGNSCVPGLPDHRTASCAGFAGRRLIGAPVPLSRHAQEGLDPRRSDPPGETAPVPAGGAQPGRKWPSFSTRCRPVKYRAILTTGCAAGLRISEALHLTVSAIDSRRPGRPHRSCPRVPARRYVGPDERRGLGAAQAPRRTATRQWRRRRAQPAASAVATDSSPRSRRATIAGAGHQLARRRGTAAGCWACWRAMPCRGSRMRGTKGVAEERARGEARPCRRTVRGRVFRSR